MMERAHVEELTAQLQTHDNVEVRDGEGNPLEVTDVSYDPDLNLIVIQVEFNYD